MLKLFKTTDKVFNSNGDKIIKPLKAKIHKEDNGSFYLDLETDLQYINDLKERAIIVAPTPQGEQAFRINNVQKTRKKISTKAHHVFYDSKNYLIKDNYIVDKDCNYAIRYLNANTDNRSPFTVMSDVEKTASFRCVRNSLYEAIQTILEKWGGHLVRDNFNIKIMSNIGEDNGVTIQYAKNLEDLTSVENWDEVVTKLLPVGKDGILLNHLDKDVNIYIDAPAHYELPYTKKVNFSQDISEDAYKDEHGKVNDVAFKQALISDLSAQAQQYIKSHYVPKVNYTLKANIDHIIDIGDTIEVIDERLSINVLTNVTSYDYDCILKKYTEITFGNFQPKLSNTLNNFISSKITNSILQNNLSLQNQISNAVDKLWNELDLRAHNVMTAYLSLDLKKLKTGTYTKVVFQHTKGECESFELVDGGIQIKRDVHTVKITASVLFKLVNTDSTRSIVIAKNSSDPRNFLGVANEYLTAGQSYTMTVPPIIANVQANDIIYLYYKTSSANDIISGHQRGFITYLTLEVIN